MESPKLALLLMMVALALPTIVRGHGSHMDEEDEWFKAQLNASYHRSLEAKFPDPEEEVSTFNHHVHLAFEEEANSTRHESNNSTRRGLRRINDGICRALNPIDRCWRCHPDWASNRKLLALCSKGFGRRATGGLRGAYYTVYDHTDDDLVNPKPGTFRHAVLQNRPLWIIFDHDMIITLKAELIITGDKTIDGRGARVDIAHGAGLVIQFTRNVIIHGIRIYKVRPMHGGFIRDTWNHVGIRAADDGDGLTIFASQDVWVDHLSMWDCGDGLIDVVRASTGVTISNCHFTRHNDVMLFGASDFDPRDEVMQVTVAFNHFGKKLIQRMPRSRYGFVHVVNNDYTHWEMYAIGGSSHPTIISQGNRYTAPFNHAAKQVTTRNLVVGDGWKRWQWRSENDLMRNGAFFVESGLPFVNHKYNNKDFIPAKHGSYAPSLSRYAGYIRCRRGLQC